MTAKGKINASKVTTEHRIIVKVSADGTVRPSDTKTGEGVQVARVTGKGMRAAGAYEARGKYIVETSAGSFEAAPIQTMWLAPEDPAGIKRAMVEAQAEDKRQNRAATPAEVEAPAQAEVIRQAAEAARQAPTAEAAAEIMAAAMDLPVEALAAWVDSNWTAPAAPVDVEPFPAGHRNCPDSHYGERCPLPADEAPAVTVAARPTPSPALRAQMVGRVLRLPETGLTLPLRSEGRELVRVADLLTLHSQAGKVQDMNNASDTETTPAQPTATENHTGSTVVSLLEKVWARIRADHPELPEVVIITGSGLVGASKWGHFRAEGWKVKEEGAALRKHELFLAGEALAKGATQVLQTMLHEGAHTLAKVRGQQDTSRQGRWHNQTFRKTAEEMGLEHKGSSADKSHGFSFVTLTPATKERYADLLEELDREIRLVCHLPVWLGGADEDDEKGGEKIGKAPKGEDEGDTKPKSGNLKATCQCEEPVIVRLSQKVLDLGVVKCTECDSLFTAA